eukprot:scaffold184_cov316-Pinguiococcus_pyrenoidosus.AAC.59
MDMDSAVFQGLSTPMICVDAVKLDDLHDGQAIAIRQQNDAFAGLSPCLLDSSAAVAEHVVVRTFDQDPFIPMQKLVVVIGPRQAPVLLHWTGLSADKKCDLFEVEANCLSFYNAVNAGPLDGSWLAYPLHGVEYMDDLFWSGVGVTDKPLPMHSPTSWQKQLYEADVGVAMGNLRKQLDARDKQPSPCSFIVRYRLGSEGELVSIWRRGLASISNPATTVGLQISGKHTDVSHLTSGATKRHARRTREVRTRLATVVGAFDALDCAAHDDAGDVWNILRSSIQQLRTVVNGTVTLSDLSSGSLVLRPERTCLRDLLATAKRIMYGRTQVGDKARALGEGLENRTRKADPASLLLPPARPWSKASSSTCMLTGIEPSLLTSTTSTSCWSTYFRTPASTPREDLPYGLSAAGKRRKSTPLSSQTRELASYGRSRAASSPSTSVAATCLRAAPATSLDRPLALA